jgi:type I restriction enzyme S subunit
MKQGWEIKKLGEVCEIINGGTPDTTVPRYWDGENLWITPKDMGKLDDIYVYETSRKITDAGLKNSSAKMLPLNSIILSSRAPIGHLAINKKPVSTNQGCKGIIPTKKATTLYLYYFLSNSVDLLNNLGTGTTFKELSGSKLATVEIPLPPLHEQQSIVAFINEAFASIAIAKANAEQNLKNAKELFESYLQNVVTNKEKGWEEKKLSEITSLLGDGLHGTPKYDENGEYYFINGNNLDNGKITYKDSTKKVSVKEYEKYKKKLNDRTILVSINGTLGNVAFYHNEKVILGKSACYFNLKEGVDKDFIKYIISSTYYLKYAHKEATGATIKNVSLKTMREFIVPLPSLKIQQTIVHKLDALSSETKRLESNYQQKLSDLEELKKSVLQKALNGELKTNQYQHDLERS